MQFKVGDTVMTPGVDLEPLRLNGLDEASLYHDPGQHGFFSLLWCDSRQEPRIERLRQEKRQLKLYLAAVQDLDSVHYGPSGKIAKVLEAQINKLPNLKPKIQKSY